MLNIFKKTVSHNCSKYDELERPHELRLRLMLGEDKREPN